MTDAGTRAAQDADPVTDKSDLVIRPPHDLGGSRPVARSSDVRMAPSHGRTPVHVRATWSAPMDTMIGVAVATVP